MIRSKEDWFNWLATTCVCNHIRPDWLEIDGYCTTADVQVIKRIIFTRHTHAPAVKGHAPLERISVGRPRPSNREVQLALDFSL